MPRGATGSTLDSGSSSPGSNPGGASFLFWGTALKSKAIMQIDYAKHLNPQQLKVVSEGDGYVLVLAGAGSGKTRTIVYRVAYLLENGVHPDEILLLTFTIKAAKEMLGRVEKLLGTKISGIWGGTFHHIANRILRKFSPKIGLSQNYLIIDDEDAKSLIAQSCKELGFNTKNGMPSPSTLKHIKGLSINTMQGCKQIIEQYFEQFLPLYWQISKVLSLYEEKKKENNLLDFDDLLQYCFHILSSNETIRKTLSRKFKYVLVDEYQDTSLIQAKIVELLSSYHKNLLVVGDDAQSIYSFRGATVENILSFPKNYPNTKTFHLSQNYRSTPEVLYLANATVEKSCIGYKKKLIPISKSCGEIPLVVKTDSQEEEANFIANQISMMIDEEKISPEQIAVLVRTSYQAAKLELSLAYKGIPYRIRGGLRFFEQAHIKDVLAFFRIFYNPTDFLSWQRIVCMFPGVGNQTAQKLFPLCPQIVKGTIPQSLPKLSKKSQAAIESLSSIFSFIQKNSLSSSCHHIIDTIYLSYLQQAYDEPTSREEDLAFLTDFLSQYDDVESLLSDISISENFKKENSLGNQEKEMVTISTIHQAKGLEWDIVFVMGVVDGQLPHSRSLSDPYQLEEERRLFYVAITRARKQLIITSPTNGFDYRFGASIPKQSRFLDELPPDSFRQLSPYGSPVW